MQDLLLTLGGFLAMGGLCSLLERLWPERSDQPAWRTDSATDAAYFALRIILSALLVVVMAFIGRSLPDRVPHLAGKFPLPIQVVFVLLLSDLFQYWLHRLHHEWKPLWWVHAVHHSPERIDWLVAARVHPLELALGKVTTTFFISLLGFAPDAFAMAVPATAVYSLLLHSNLTWGYGWLGYVFASPAFHHWHHSSEPEAIDTNYAQVFSFYDFLFGTAYFPRDRVSVGYGLAHPPFVPDGVVRQFWFPVVRWRDMWRFRRSAAAAQGNVREPAEPEAHIP